ncbi:MAG: carboxypeptidase regulatory-like domain-containing protein [Deltaproteobacteria bacterium]|nr:MAG: carboxypeptidase regulatory-like domain-containing protein [Deltaproteobacteria bacterium]
MNKEYYSSYVVKSVYQLQRLVIFFLAFFVIFSGQFSLLLAAEPGVLEGRILNIEEEPVMNAEVYIFDSPNVKRPADFISNRTGEDGRYQVQLPQGNYWAVGVFRQGGGRFGPLAYGDKHSGEAVALEVAAGVKRNMDFTVVNLREAARKHQKKSADLIKVSGKLRHEYGGPAAMAYAMAHKMEQFGTLPDYISAWTDEKGEYVLYLPPGRYYLGASVGFPPKHGYNLYLDQQFIDDVENLDLIVDKSIQ